LICSPIIDIILISPADLLLSLPIFLHISRHASAMPRCQRRRFLRRALISPLTLMMLRLIISLRHFISPPHCLMPFFIIEPLPLLSLFDITPFRYLAG
jgi:hypothetical protein